MSVIAANLNDMRTRVVTAATSAGRDPASVRLVAVSKTKPIEDLLVAYGEGQRHFGENYVQELVDKAAQLPSDIQWHFIGTMQSNKVKQVASIPNLFAIETVDGSKKADTIQKEVAKLHRETPLNVFVQVNTSGEESKGGVEPKDCVDVAKHIVERCQNLKLAGLMTIGSWDNSHAEGTNPDFKLLTECRDKVKEALGVELELSMGMSDDFELAIKMGSTNVRLGSCIFGARAKKADAKVETKPLEATTAGEGTIPANETAVTEVKLAENGAEPKVEKA
ncbi:hypothetical protein BCR33DRAFT_720656 [Rhizoclosmatium globosum]|uniref:Pyridoxal phosphate homeostasis protein n=1 Tax=Rhizoclosmatium globosum TaxID=329046 RepID=A0A1Y2BV70_9FUNG|nr:hypothetical protein BCR33DRAFT_720656 [Rhizoclosmatium globosum]|eukprot:ORY38646.1 hypothetical protein BCR33DRAFT_720656 [Rhizoclosmatium globosum]